jgi:chromosome segregation ATPase
MSVFLFFSSIGWGQSGFTQKDRDLLIELRTRMMEIDKRFEQIDKRFEQVDKRFEQVDIRFSELRQDMNNRFEQIMNTIWILAALFTAIVVGTIGFALWDRRTMIRPFESKVAKLEEKIENNKQTNQKLHTALKDFAATHKRFAEILHRLNLL